MTANNLSFEEKQRAAVEHAKTVLETHREWLLSLENVVGTGVGLRQKGGQWTDTIVLVVMVTRKLPLSALAEDQRIPPEIDGIPVDVQETGSPMGGG